MHKEIRYSNFELLRLICMLFILFHHFIIHGLKTAGYWDNYQVSFNGLFFNSFLIIAVNCFILISGYFSIKPTVKGFLRLYLFCFFYKMGLSLLSMAYVGELNLKSLISPFFPLSHGLWFIKVYVYLYLFSPLLNLLVNKISKREFIAILLPFSILTFYFGFLHRGVINSNGYNVMNFMFLYLIGRFIALYTEDTTSRNKKIACMATYVIGSLLTAGFAIILYHYQTATWIFSYNNPLVILSSVAFFLFFRTLRIKSKIINWFASSCLAIYLIQENPLISTHLYKYIGETSARTTNDLLLAGYLVVLAAGIMVVCILIDKIRMFIMNPVEKAIGKIKFEKYIERLSSYFDCKFS